jgi:hypothetical protein
MMLSKSLFRIIQKHCSSDNLQIFNSSHTIKLHNVKDQLNFRQQYNSIDQADFTNNKSSFID